MVVWASSCQDNDLVESKKTGVDLSRPVKTNLSFGVPESHEVTVTRAGNSESDILSTGVRIYVFDMNGNYLSTQDILGENLVDVNEDPEGHHYEARNVTLYVGSQRVYALANITRSGYFENATDLLDRLEENAVEGGESSFLETYYTLANSTVDDQTYPQFSGGYMPLSGVGDVTVDARGDTDDIVRMKRLVAQVKFIVNTEYSIPNTDRKAVFTPQTYTFYNIPKQGLILENKERTTDFPEDNAGNFYNAIPENFGVISETTKQATFEKFVPESIRQGQKTCGDDYDKREAFEGQGDNKEWNYAPKYGMYVVLRGTYSETETGSDSDGNEINTLKKYGNVSYTIHLGDFSANKFDNYAVERNNIYTYTVTVHGVDKIKVEAETETGDYQNGAEGDIIELDEASQVFNLDSHYEQVYVDFNLNHVVNLIKSAVEEDEQNGEELEDERLRELIGGNFMLSFRTPFNNEDKVVRPYYDPEHPDYSDDESACMSGIDYKWVEFLPQNDASVISYYPSNRNSLLNAWEVCHKMGDIVYQLYKNGAVSDSQGLIISDDNEVRFTVFVNEYFYERDLAGNKVGWKSFTNQEDRVMLIASDMKISSDLNSTYSTALTYISQASIETFYNSDDDNAMGIETYNENGNLGGFGSIYPIGSYQQWVPGHWDDGNWIQGYYETVYTYADFWTNGRANTICNISDQNGHTEEDDVKLPVKLKWSQTGGQYGGPNIRWDEIGYTADNSITGNKPLEGGINGRYVRAYNACLTRNRDLDGDGYIDENELRWYLPAISQYLRIGIGSRALSADTRLYNGDKDQMTYGSYPINYIDEGALYWTSNESRNFYWAVEMGAYGSRQGSNAQIRCVRNLPKKSLIPQDGDAPVGDIALAGAIYGEVKTINSGENYLFDFGNQLVPSIFRPSSQPQQRPYVSHNEEDDTNNLPEAFVVAEHYVREQRQQEQWPFEIVWTDIRFNDLEVVYNLDTDPCNGYDEEDGAVGWRTPNLSELMIMAQAQATHAGLNLLKTDADTYSSTQFSNLKVRRGFVYSGSLVMAPDPSPNPDDSEDMNYRPGYIRCVRDATIEERNSAVAWNGN